MGDAGSKSSGHTLSNVPPPQQPPEPPYPGPPAQYHFVNTQVSVGTQMTFSFLSAPMVTSNIDQYYPVLAAPYEQGFRLLSFYGIPGQQQAEGLFTNRVAMGYQGFFCRYPTAPSHVKYQLRIEKSVIQLQNRYTGMITLNQAVDSDTSHVLSAIARNTQDGGRLICIEMTGAQQGQNFRNAMHGLSPLFGVDLFFEVPVTPTPDRYVYNCVSVPITVTVSGFPAYPRSQCDWVGNLAAYLNQGWKLIEIFMDKAQQQKAFSFQSQMNSIWYFEKPAARINDPTPMYQGTIVDHEIKIQAAFAGSHAKTNWEPVIQDMGNKGWELACILELPDVHQSGFTTVKMACKLFFQRPILPQQAFAPPPYSAAMGGASQEAPTTGGFHPHPPAPGFNLPSPPEKMGY